MAHLEVKRKRSSNWWLWLLVILIILAALYYFFRDRIDVNSLVSSGSAAGTLVILSHSASQHLFKRKF